MAHAKFFDKQQFLKAFAEKNGDVGQLSKHFNCSPGTIRYHSDKYDLRTKRVRDKELQQNILTDREIQLFMLILEGCHTQDLSKKLFIAPKTIKFHLSSILVKCGLRGRRRADLISKYYCRTLPGFVYKSMKFFNLIEIPVTQSIVEKPSQEENVLPIGNKPIFRA